MIDNILAKLKITELNQMQQESYCSIMNTDGDLVILSPTGTGKTLAYMLGLAGLLNPDADEVQALVIVPGRELALQSDGVLKSMGTALRSASCYGGRPAMDEHRTLKKVRPHIIFGTPGRLNDHIDKGNISPYGIRYIVIDEFDKCLEMGFHQEMARLVKSLPGVRRRFLLSATDMEQIPEFVRVGGTVKRSYIDSSNKISERVSSYTVKSASKDKLETLDRLLRALGEGSSIVFLNHRDSVERVYGYLTSRGFVACQLHGGLDQKLREYSLYKFSNGSANVLVATDLASRGIDVDNVSNIIHYQLPYTKEEYIHRTGRTARWKAGGNVFFILGPDESCPEFIESPCESYSIPDGVGEPPVPQMNTLYIGKGKKDKISKGDIVGFLCKKGGLKASEIGRIDVEERYTYVAVQRTRINQLLSQVCGEKIKGVKTVVEIIK